MNPSSTLDFENLARHLSEGTIAKCDGPDGLTLYNYTQRAQFTGAWDNETLTCRGIVLDTEGRVQSRPFRKFFNLGEHASPFLPDLPVEPFEVYEKLDGSMIAASQRDGVVLLTTRGSFTSEQAIAAQKLWAERYNDVEIPDDETWCFEFIAPWNRIVVNYGERTDLVWLARFDNTTGDDMLLHDALPDDDLWPGPVVRRFDGLDDFDEITARLDRLTADEEGYVLRFASGMRAKAKGAEYLRLHKILTGVSAKTIWECLANGSGLNEILDRVPDEFYAWATTTADGLRASFTEVEGLALARHAEIAHLPSRKHQALAIADFEHRAIVFRLLDGKTYGDYVWKHIRPAADRPFVVDDATSDDEVQPPNAPAESDTLGAH